MNDLLVLFAKIPLKGRTKTRLVSSGCTEELAYDLSLAMLQDTLMHFNNRRLCSQVVWYYAPSSMESEAHRIVEQIEPNNQRWDLVPMSENEHLTSSSLGNLLIEAVNSLASCPNTSTMTFIASDTPHLHPSQVSISQQSLNSREIGQYDAYICPATDGGYVLLSLYLPTTRHCCQQIFEDVEWSTDRTCQSQVIALQKLGLSVKIGPTYRDIDELCDLQYLWRLFSTDSPSLPVGEVDDRQSELLIRPQKTLDLLAPSQYLLCDRSDGSSTTSL